MRQASRACWIAVWSACAACDNANSPQVTPRADAGHHGSQPDALEGYELVHSFGTLELAPFEEQWTCAQWTLQNEQALYVQTVTVANDGSFHHSNWFFVPEDTSAGEDGFFPCADRSFEEVGAAVSGGVLYAQSTQSRLESQRLPEGVVIKIPPRHKIVSSTHLLNPSSVPTASELRVAFDLLHPKDVNTVVTGLRLTYRDLHIPAQGEARFRGECDIASAVERATGQPLDFEIYYVLPHYHYQGNHFALEVLGGEDDARSLHTLDGFNADANGMLLEPAASLRGARGLRFTCGYRNTLNREVTWGFGDGEMCVMLALTSSDVLVDAVVRKGAAAGEDDGVALQSGTCEVIALNRSPTQGMPTKAELSAPLYIPDTQDAAPGRGPVAACEDSDPRAAPASPATLTGIAGAVFTPSCAFSACHAPPANAAGLDLTAEDLHGALLAHKVQADTELPLVTKGQPEQSWLYLRMSRCAPEDAKGKALAHMPQNAPRLLSDGLVAAVRDWIAAGAKDD